jgi:hypothetical protein
MGDQRQKAAKKETGLPTMATPALFLFLLVMRRKQVIKDRRVVPARALLLARSVASLRTMRDSSLANKNPSLLACLYESIAHYYRSRAWQSQFCGHWLVGVDHVARPPLF